jgi:hypothetical protein
MIDLRDAIVAMASQAEDCKTFYEATGQQFIELLKHPDPNIRCEATTGLWTLAYVDALPALREAHAKETSGIEKTMAYVIGLFEGA